MIRTNLTTDFQHCTETGGKPKFISILLIFFMVVVLDELKLLQKLYCCYSRTEKTEKSRENLHTKILPKNLNACASINSKLNIKYNPYAIIFFF